MTIDLHTHSTASDGVDSPAEVLRAAAAAGLTVVALTDHDTTAGWGEAAEAAEQVGVRLIPGTEISCLADGISVHLLSYLNDPDDPGLLAEFRRVRAERDGRARRMVERIAADHDLSWEDVEARVAPGATVGRPHIADALVDLGIVPSRDAAFDTLLHRESPYYLPYYAPDAADAVRLIRAAGGVPVMAHPLAGRRGRVVSHATIAALAEEGLLGLEADHPDHTDEERAVLRGLARDLGLLCTGSSDYHGRVRGNVLGQFTTGPEVLDAIVAAATGAGTGTGIGTGTDAGRGGR